MVFETVLVYPGIPGIYNIKLVQTTTIWFGLAIFTYQYTTRYTSRDLILEKTKTFELRALIVLARNISIPCMYQV